MLTYLCKNCNDLVCETSICPVCGSKTELLESKIFWSKEYNCPSFDQTSIQNSEIYEYIGSDIRPVFPKERLLIEILINKPMKYAGKSIWNVSGSTYVVEGKKVKLNFKDLIKNNKCEDIIERIKEYSLINKEYENNFFNNEYIKNFILINKTRLETITGEAISYIKETSKSYSIDEMFVSFSGGKDSTVTSDIVTKALGTKRIVHIYGDTTLEYPTSGEYIKRFKLANSETPVLVAKNIDQDFNNLCEVIGPPSRVMRWCCTVFKTGAITKKIESTFKDKKRVISFQGIRRNESKSRSKYDRETTSPKITKQLAISPIIDWLDFDVWLYILSNNLDFNDAYKQGFSRVGCWCCPNNSNWSAYLSSIYMNDDYNKFMNILYKFAKDVGKMDWKEYVDEGKWKARQGGNGLKASGNTVVSFKPCALEENAYNYELSKPIDETLYTLFKPFGTLNFSIGNKRLNEVYVLDKRSNEPILKLSGRLGSNNLKITILKNIPAFKNKVIAENMLKAQITKYQACLACGACQSVCKHNAIKILNTQKGDVSNSSVSYVIDENKCLGCLECVLHFDGGCYMKKVLRTKLKEN